jgi:hypothetical protein
MALKMEPPKMDLSPEELMEVLKREGSEKYEAAAIQDAHDNARRLAVVIENFLSEDACDELIRRAEDGLLQETPSKTLASLEATEATEGAEGAQDPRLQQLAADVKSQLWERMQQLGSSENSANKELFRQLQTADAWSCMDYATQYQRVDAMEMRLCACSDKIRVMRYTADEKHEKCTSSTEDGSAVDAENNGKHKQHDGQDELSQAEQSFSDPRTMHFDGRNHRPEGDSFLTMLVYLNDSYEHGRTIFLNSSDKAVAKVEPQKGMALIFDHHLYHQGEELTTGQKYLLRSDLLYAPFDASIEKKLAFVSDGCFNK